jgi:hypothetical protein
MTNRSIVASIAIVALLGASGCSLAFVHKPPLTRSYTLPIVDTLIALAGTSVETYAVSRGCDKCVSTEVIWPIAIFAGSAIYGFQTVQKRRDVDKQLESSRLAQLRADQLKHERIHRELTEAVEQAARTGNCDTLRKLDQLAFDLDANPVSLIARCPPSATVSLDAGVPPLDAPTVSAPVDETP